MKRILAALLLLASVAGAQVPAPPRRERSFVVPREATIKQMLEMAKLAGAEAEFANPVDHDVLIIRFKEEGTTVVTRSAGLLNIDCVGTGVTCTFAGSTVTITIADAGVGGAAAGEVLYNNAGSVDGIATNGSSGSVMLITCTLADGKVPIAVSGAWQCGLPGIQVRVDSDGTVALVAGDLGDEVQSAHATANAVSIAQAGTTGFESGWFTRHCVTGTGPSTITPATSTINATATIKLYKGDCALIKSDGANYTAEITRDSIEVQLVAFDFTTDTATGDGKFYFHVNNNSRLVGKVLADVFAQVITNGTTNTTDVQIARCTQAATGAACSGTVADMLSTKITIDSGENTSATAAAAAVINASNDDISAGDVLRVDVDAVSTTAAKGLIITLIFRRP